jgi:hypothetical protein
MNQKGTLKSTLHQFVWEWGVEQRADNMLGMSYLYEKIRQSDWLPQIKALPEEERVAVLQDAFVTDPPNHPPDKTNYSAGVGPQPIIAFWIGVICLDTQQAVEDLFTAALRHRADGRWAYTAVKRLGPMRTIDLIFQTYQDPGELEDFLYDFELTLLPAVAPEDRNAVRRHYKKCRIASIEQSRPFSSHEETKEYLQRLDAVLAHYLDRPYIVESYRC